MYRYTDEQNNKKFFVTQVLEDLLRELNIGIQHAEYAALDEDAEVVVIKFENGEQKTVNVSGDSLLALVKDVINKIYDESL